MPIDVGIRVLGVRFARLGRWNDFAKALAKKAAGRVAATQAAVGVVGTMRRRHLVVLYDAYSHSVIEWSVAAWGFVGNAALGTIAVVEARARRFALGAGSYVISREGLAALLCAGTSEVRFVELRARAALQHANDIGRCEVHRALQLAIAALPAGVRLLARGLSCISAAADACAKLGPAVPAAGTHAAKWRAAIKAAARQLGEWRAAENSEKSNLALFRACAPTLAWCKEWILDESAAGEAWSAFIVLLLDGCYRPLPVARLVRLAATGEEHPFYCDFGCAHLGRDADAAHVFFECPVWAPHLRSWLRLVDESYATTPATSGAAAWWQSLRARVPCDATVAAELAAAGCPHLPVGRLGALRDRLARDFVGTVGMWAASRATYINALSPPRRQ